MDCSGAINFDAHTKKKYKIASKVGFDLKDFYIEKKTYIGNTMLKFDKLSAFLPLANGVTLPAGNISFSNSISAKFRQNYIETQVIS